MRHLKKRGKLGVKTEHRKALLRNLVKSLVAKKRIRTTLARAKQTSAFADKLVNLAKRGEDLHVRRQIISKLGCPDAARVLIKDIAPHFKVRNGGYTRVLRMGARPGDAAETAIVEFTEMIALPEKPKKKKVKKAKTAEKGESTVKKSASKADAPEREKETAKPDSDEKGKKESDKKGGFLGALRKFLKSDEK